MRLSDILKRINQQDPRQETSASKTPAADLPAHDILQTPAAPVSPAPVTPEKMPATTIAPAAAELTAEELYTRIIVEFKNLASVVDKNTPSTDTISIIPALVSYAAERNTDILVFADRATPDVYLYGHSVNVAIIATMIAVAAGFERERLEELATIALLHDLGMIKYLGIVLKQGKLSAVEYDQVRKHSQFGKDIVRLLPSLPENIRTILPAVIQQIHERADGSGYPSGIRLDSIHAYARIIGIADVYEALTHPRPYRDRILPHAALKLMITTAEEHFDSRMLRAFIENISLFPPGSYVRLNTDELARVVGTCPGMPTRPKVRIIADADLRKLPEGKNADLQCTPTIFVKEAVDETNLKIPDKKFQLELKARRWWVRGF
jgi:HD-GYP domain-containing protein (c-di-GMP phosphodiesterase class II)